MSKFNDPFIVTVTPNLCDDKICLPCTPTPNTDGCFICGYPSGYYPPTTSTTCLSGSVSCLHCEDVFQNLDIKFLGGFVSGFSSHLGFGASESTLNIDIVIPKYKCMDETISSPMGVCCEPDQSCSTLYSGKEDCENAGGTWYADKSCSDNPCQCTGCPEADGRYEGRLGYIYTFNMGSFCFRGILNNHTYTEDSSGYKYKILLTDGRNLLNDSAVLMNGSYSKLPAEFINSAINVGSIEDSVSNNNCGNGEQCKDFMITGSGSSRGIKLKTAIKAINHRCLSVPVSQAGLKVNVNKLINIIPDDLRTNNTESTVLELITLACNESGYDFFVKINNDNELEIIPINYKKPATPKSLFSFVEDLSARDIVINKEYGEEMASGNANKNKRIVFGNNISYLTRVRDFSYQRLCSAPPSIPSGEGLCCDSGGINLDANKQSCEDNGGIWYPYLTSSSLNHYDTLNNEPLYPDGCYMQLPCSIINNPASIGSYDTFYIVPTPLPSGYC